MNSSDNYLNCNANGGMDPNKFREMVRERAYFKAERRGFAGGHEVEDWLEAEKEISNQCRYWYLDNDPS
ncbi:MAG: DUF2934 domain-containing protein [Gammaproteobacteria bacterium]